MKITSRADWDSLSIPIGKLQKKEH